MDAVGDCTRAAPVPRVGTTGESSANSQPPPLRQVFLGTDALFRDNGGLE